MIFCRRIYQSQVHTMVHVIVCFFRVNYWCKWQGLACRCCGSDNFPSSRYGFHCFAAQTSFTRHNFWSGPQMRSFFISLLLLKRGPWEMIASILIAMGVIMMMQPLLLIVYTYSFIVTLVGTVMFIIVSHFPE